MNPFNRHNKQSNGRTIGWSVHFVQSSPIPPCSNKIYLIAFGNWIDKEKGRRGRWWLYGWSTKSHINCLSRNLTIALTICGVKGDHIPIIFTVSLVIWELPTMRSINGLHLMSSTLMHFVCCAHGKSQVLFHFVEFSGGHRPVLYKCFMGFRYMYNIIIKPELAALNANIFKVCTTGEVVILQ